MGTEEEILQMGIIVCLSRMLVSAVGELQARVLTHDKQLTEIRKEVTVLRKASSVCIECGEVRSWRKHEHCKACYEKLFIAPIWTGPKLVEKSS